jgi:hypothetical protein
MSMSSGLDLGDIFFTILDAVQPIIIAIADTLGLGVGALISFFFGGIEFILTEFLFR